MRRTAILLAAVWAVGYDDPNEQPSKELAELQGAWAAVSFEANGQAVPTSKAGWRVVLKGKRVSIRFGGLSLEGDVVLGQGGNHRALDVTRTEGTIDLGAGGPGTFLPGQMDVAGIYKVEGGKLTVCYRFGTRRPPDFQTRQGNSMVQVFERAK